LVSLHTLTDEIREYLVELDESLGSHEFLDLETAKTVAKVCERLLAALPENASNGERQLVQIAVRYFIEDEDAEGDLSSPIGFDDDAEVVAAIARELGLEDVLRVSGVDK
jgi:hypothetical protein